jgi:hypothetical protein
MSRENPLWGAPRLLSELFLLGHHAAERTVAKDMVRTRKPPSPTWRTFLANHVPDIAACDFFTVPTVTFRVLMIQQGVARWSHAEEKYAHLAVLLLADAPAPLTLHADALRPVLDKARTIDHAHGADWRLGRRGHELFVEHRMDLFLLHCLNLPGRETVRNRCLCPLAAV